MMMNTSNGTSVCAACGKTGDNLKICTACKLVKYCNRDCQILHRQKHKKECRQRAAIQRAGDNNTSNSNIIEISKGISNVSISGGVSGSTTTADKKMNTSYEQNNNYEDIRKVAISDDELFKDPPPKEDCPICMQPMPFSNGVCGVGTVYQGCCGKTICCGCESAAHNEMNKGKLKRCCPFCRIPVPRSDKELLKMYHKRLNMNDAPAFDQLGSAYMEGDGLPRDLKKALELWNKAAELGSCKAHYNLSIASHIHEEDVEVDEDKAMHHCQLAAIGGHEIARHNLGASEASLGNMNRAMKHFMIAARCGHDDSLHNVGVGYKHGLVTKEDYASTLRAHKAIQDEMKSVQRTEASTFDDNE